MAKKGGSKGSAGYDHHNLTSEQKQKVASLSEQFPELKRDHIAMVLEQSMFDPDKAVDQIMADGGRAAYSNWLATQTSQTKVNNRNKKKNKKKTKKDDGTITSMPAHCTDADDSSSIHSSNIDYDGEKELSAKIECDVTNDHTVIEPLSLGSAPVSNATCDAYALGNAIVENTIPRSPLRNVSHPPEIEKTEDSSNAGEPDSSATRGDACNSNAATEDHALGVSSREKTEEVPRYMSQKPTHKQRHGNSNYPKPAPEEVPVKQDSNVPKQSAAAFTKCKKDLARQSISLQRIQLQLDNKLEDASKLLKNTFAEVRKTLNERQTKLEEEMEKVRIEAVSLLKSRLELASELKMRTDRSLSESEWNDLRVDIKQFVIERKYDEEMGRTVWFHYSPDTIMEEIGKLGEVCPVKNSYSQRQLSRTQNSSEPSSPHSVNDNDEPSLAASSTDETVAVVDGNQETEDVKIDKDVQAKTTFTGENRSRTFSSKRFNYQGNLGNKHPGNYKSRAYFSKNPRHMSNNYGPRMRHFEDYQQYSGMRHNDYRQAFPHHERMEYHPNEDKSSEAPPMHLPDNGSGGFRFPFQHRDSQPHFRGHDQQRPYRGHQPHFHQPHNYRRGGRANNRPPRQSTDMTQGGGLQAGIDKNANYDREFSQESKDIQNGY